MIVRAHTFTHAEFIEAGGWEPSAVVAEDDWVVIAHIRDDGTIESASWAPPEEHNDDRYNSDVPRA